VFIGYFTTISAIVCFPDSDRQSCADETRLWQRYVGWFTDLPTESPPICSQRCSSIDRRFTSLRSRHWYSCQFSLASCSWAHRFQTGGPCIPSSARHCTSIPVWPSPRCWLAVSSSSTVGDFPNLMSADWLCLLVISLLILVLLTMQCTYVCGHTVEGGL